MHLAVSLVDHTLRFFARELERMHRRLIDDRQILPPARLIQISDHHRLALAILYIVRRRAYTIGLGNIKIRTFGQAHAVGRIEKCSHGRGCRHVESEVTLYVERAVFTVDRAIGEILVRLDLFHKWQASIVTPVRITCRNPLIEIVALWPQNRHHVHRRAAAHDPAGEGVIRAAIQMTLSRKHRNEIRL